MAEGGALGKEKSMTVFDDSKPLAPDTPPDPRADARDSLDDLPDRIIVGTPEPVDSSGRPVSLSGVPPPPAQYQQNLPEDLRIPWGWMHFLGFFIFGIVSFIVTQVGATLYLMSQSHGGQMTQK